MLYRAARKGCASRGRLRGPAPVAYVGTVACEGGSQEAIPVMTQPRRRPAPASAALAATLASILAAVPAGSAPAATPGPYYLNVCCEGQRYRIMRFGPDGRPDPAAPVIGEENLPADAAGTAWPSAIRVRGRVYLYASRLVAGTWADVALWESQDGRSFLYRGPVLAALPSEIQGIGPAQVFYDPAGERPFRMVYLVRGAPPSGGIALASSEDGVHWRREGTVLEPSEPWEAAGVSPSWVMRLSDGRWALFYHAYETRDLARAAVALAPGSEGPFSGKSVILSPVPSRVPVVAPARRGSSRLRVPEGHPVRLGEPYVLKGDGEARAEPVVPRRRRGAVVELDRPLEASHRPGTMAHVGSRKVDPSVVTENPDGSFSGVFTGYGQFGNLTSEYTFRVSSPRLGGPWRVEPAGLAFEPWFPAGRASTENPTIVLEGPPAEPQGWR